MVNFKTAVSIGMLVYYAFKHRLGYAYSNERATPCDCKAFHLQENFKICIAKNHAMNFAH